MDTMHLYLAFIFSGTQKVLDIISHVMLLQSDQTIGTILETSIHMLHCYVKYAIDISHCFFMLFYMSVLMTYISHD